MIGIEGSIQTRKYQDKDGNNRTAFEVVANNVQFVEFKKADNNPDNNAPVDPENDPLNEFQDKLNEFQDLGNVDDEDLPYDIELEKAEKYKQGYDKGFKDGCDYQIKLNGW